jgi:aromatic-L-amino-acid/L-tryptophan decarboxylase
MQSEEFRRHAHAMVDWMADYLRDVGTLPIAPVSSPGEIRQQLPASPPDQAEPFEHLFADFQRVIVPGMTHWNHPGWMAYFPCNNSPPSVLGEMLTSAIGAQGMSWATSPAATELEQTVMDWLRQMLGLPTTFTGVIQDTASTATLVALLTARERATGFASGERGLAAVGAGLTVYASSEAHSSVDKAVKLAGYGLDQLRRVPTDTTFALRPDELDRLITTDRTNGLVPACVVASVGTTSSTAVDPLPEIAAVCRSHGAWLHVDAAYAGAAALVPELRAPFAGVENADSFVFNPHKWMLTNFDCTAYFVRDTSALLRTFQATPEYLRTAHDPEAVNYRDWGIQLGRRFRALKLWFVIRCYGVEGLRAMIREHVALAREFATWIAARDDFEVMAPVPFGLVCFRFRPAGKSEAELDRLNQQLLERVNETRRFYLTHTRLGGRYVIRLVVGQRTTKREHVEAVWREIQKAANA